MENLEIQVTQQSGVINTNFDELKEMLKKELEPYKNLTVSEDEIKFAKEDLAYLRKQRTEIENRRKEIKNEYSKPLTDFESSCKELTGLFDDAIKNITDQLDLFEADRIKHKRERIGKLYVEQVGEYIDYLPLEANYNEKWDNKSYSDNDIIFDISAKITKIKSDLDVIKSLSSEIEDEVIATYKANGNDLASAIKRNSQYLADKQKIAEQAKEVANSEPKSELVEETPKSAPLQQLDDLAKTIRMHHFIVSEADAEEVREMLSFANITFREE